MCAPLPRRFLFQFCVVFILTVRYLRFSFSVMKIAVLMPPAILALCVCFLFLVYNRTAVAYDPNKPCPNKSGVYHCKRVNCDSSRKNCTVRDECVCPEDYFCETHPYRIVGQLQSTTGKRLIGVKTCVKQEI